MRSLYFLRQRPFRIQALLLSCLPTLVASGCNTRDSSLADPLGIDAQDTGMLSTTGSSSTPSTTPQATDTSNNQNTSGTSTLPPPPTLKAVRALGDSSCAIYTDGSLRCWGANDQGQLGLGDNRARGGQAADMGSGLIALPLPQAVQVQELQGNSTICARSQEDELFCWGDNTHGQLGQGHNDSLGDAPKEVGKYMTSVPLGPNLKVHDYCVGGGHLCAIVGDGQVKCWGRNDQGQLGLGHTQNLGAKRNQMGANLPFVDLGKHHQGEARKAKKISCGQRHSCVLTTENKVLCWGANRLGQLGNGSTETIGDAADEMGDNLKAAAFTMRGEVLDLQSGDQHNCILMQAGSVHCWGANQQGQLGLGHRNAIGAEASDLPQLFSGIDLGSTTPVVQITTGKTHSCARTQDGALRCWGDNRLGSVGAGPVADLGGEESQMGDSLPKLSLGASFVATEVSTGHAHSCALDASAQVRCWGSNQQGQLGLGDLLDRGKEASQMGDALPAPRLSP